MAVVTEEQAVLDAVPKGCSSEASGVTRPAAEPSPSRIRPPARRSAMSPTRSPRMPWPRSTPRARLRRSGGTWRPRERGEILRRAFDELIERADELALLMTLEMGKTLKESKAEITYAAEFLRWFSEQAVRIDGRYAVAPNGAGRLLTMKQPVGPAC